MLNGNNQDKVQLEPWWPKIKCWGTKTRSTKTSVLCFLRKKSTMYMNCTMYLIDVSHHVTKTCTEHAYMYM